MTFIFSTCNVKCIAKQKKDAASTKMTRKSFYIQTRNEFFPAKPLDVSFCQMNFCLKLTRDFLPFSFTSLPGFIPVSQFIKTEKEHSTGAFGRGKCIIVLSLHDCDKLLSLDN